MKASKNFRRVDGSCFPEIGEARSVHGRVSPKEEKPARMNRSLPKWDRPVHSLGDYLRK